MKSICEKCNKDEKELFEERTKDKFIWVCYDCQKVKIKHSSQEVKSKSGEKGYYG